MRILSCCSSRTLAMMAASIMLTLSWHVIVLSQKKQTNDLFPVITFVSTRDHAAESISELFLASEIYLIDAAGYAHPGDPDNLSDLFIMNSDGSNQRHLVRGSSASWSPDGKHIVYHASASGRGTLNRRNPGSATSDSDLFILNVDDFLKRKGKPRNLTNDPTMIDEDADWSPDGKTIAFTRYGKDVPHDNASSAEIYLIDPNGREKPRRLTNNTEEERSPSWSPNGRQLAFMGKMGGTDFQACIMNADGTGMRALTSKTGRTVTWSPDGQRIVFHRIVMFGDTRDEQLFSVDLSGADEKHLTSGDYLNARASPGLLRRNLN